MRNLSQPNRLNQSREQGPDPCPLAWALAHRLQASDRTLELSLVYFEAKGMTGQLCAVIPKRRLASGIDSLFEIADGLGHQLRIISILDSPV